MSQTHKQLFFKMQIDAINASEFKVAFSQCIFSQLKLQPLLQV